MGSRVLEAFMVAIGKLVAITERRAEGYGAETRTSGFDAQQARRQISFRDAPRPSRLSTAFSRSRARYEE
jgi:hypothetical protein